MPGRFDYTTKPADIMPGLQMLGQGLHRRAAFEKERVKEEKTRKLRERAVNVFNTGTPDDIVTFIGNNPGAKDIYNEMLGTEKQMMVDEAKRWLIDNEDPVDIYTKKADEKAATGQDISNEVEDLRSIMLNYEDEKKQREKILALEDQAAWNAYKSMQEQKAESKTTAIKEFEYGEKNPKFKIAQQRKLDAKKTKEVAGKNFKNTSDLRKEFLSQSSEYKKVRDSYTRVVGSTQDPSPAGDLSLIFNYMKMLDPGSVVRESEFATAAAAGSFGERIKAATEKVVSGERLTEKMRADFVKKSKTLMKGMEDQHFKREKNYRSIAEKNGLDINEVVVDLTTPESQVEGEITQEQYDQLPSGATYQLGGKTYRKK